MMLSIFCFKDVQDCSLKKIKALADNFYIHVYVLLVTGHCHFPACEEFHGPSYAEFWFLF